MPALTATPMPTPMPTLTAMPMPTATAARLTNTLLASGWRWYASTDPVFAVALPFDWWSRDATGGAVFGAQGGDGDLLKVIPDRRPEAQNLKTWAKAHAKLSSKASGSAPDLTYDVFPGGPVAIERNRKPTDTGTGPSLATYMFATKGPIGYYLQFTSEDGKEHAVWTDIARTFNPAATSLPSPTPRPTPAPAPPHGPTATPTSPPALAAGPTPTPTHYPYTPIGEAMNYLAVGVVGFGTVLGPPFFTSCGGTGFNDARACAGDFYTLRGAATQARTQARKVRADPCYQPFIDVLLEAAILAERADDAWLGDWDHDHARYFEVLAVALPLLDAVRDRVNLLRRALDRPSVMRNEVGVTCDELP